MFTRNMTFCDNKELANWAKSVVSSEGCIHAGCILRKEHLKVTSAATTVIFWTAVATNTTNFSALTVLFLD